MSRAFNIETRRSIRASLGRFLAIAAIVALGCGFYAGLRMSGPDMRIAADRFYDGTHLYDIRLLSSLGFDEKQAQLVRETDGAEAVMLSKSTDIMAFLDGEQYAIRINSFNSEAAQTQECNDGCTVQSENPDYLNRLILEEGRWPTRQGECALSADRVMVSPVRMGDTVEVLYGAGDLDGVLVPQSFTVVGLVHSSSYVSAVTQGTTTLGSGEIQQFMYVTEDSFDSDCPYSEIYVAVRDARKEFSGSEAYTRLVDFVEVALDEKSDTIAQSRLATIASDAQKEIDDAQEAYDSEKTRADSELSDAQRTLEDTQQQLTNAQQDIDSGEAQLASGRSELESQRVQAESKLADARTRLEATQKQLDDAQKQLDEARTSIDAWDEKKAELQAQLAQTRAGIEQAEQVDAGIAELRAQLDALSAEEQGPLHAETESNNEQDNTRADSAGEQDTEDNAGQETNAVRAELQAQLDALLQQQPQAQVTIAELTETAEKIEAGIEEGDKQAAEYQKKAGEVKEGYEKLAQGWTQFYQQEAEAQRELGAAQEQIEASQTELESARVQLAEGQSAYQEGLAEYQENKKKAESELGDAAQALANARADVDALEPPDIYVLDRTKNYGVESVKADSERIDNIAAVFPFIFFLVAALVALTTMTRMVEEDRVLIGTFKALGYSKARITGKYLVYAGIASVAGAALGIAVLSQVLPAVIMRAYAIIYNVAPLPLPLPVDAKLAGLAAGMGCGVTLFATWAAMAATLREQPAQLMLPRAPKAGKRILLERIKPLWNRLGFSWKVTCRNIFRYKKRFFMTVVGIAGCTALLLTGLGLHDAIWDIIDKHFGATVRYNIVVQLDDEASTAQKETIEDIVAAQGQAQSFAWAADMNKQVGSASHGTMGVTVTVPKEAADFTNMVFMKERRTQSPVVLDDSSVLLTEKLARTLGAGTGDAIQVYAQDDIGNATGEPLELEVTGIVEYYVGNAVFVGSRAYANASDGEKLAYTSLYASATEDESARQELSEQLHAQDVVQTVAYNDEIIDSYRTMLQSVNMIVVVLVAAAAALAFIVLYNLTNINITERRREIASLKVLGFTGHEVDAYIYREIILLTLIGAASGLVLGIGMESFVVETAEVDYVMFGRDIHPVSFVCAFALTVGFSLFVMLAMRIKLKRIDMVESLKSID